MRMYLHFTAFSEISQEGKRLEMISMTDSLVTLTDLLNFTESGIDIDQISVT